jgi:hypothetical protein
MARYDKYDPKDGGFRAPLAADLPSTAATGNGNPRGVALDANGRVVVGAVGNTGGTVGVLCTTRNMKAGEIVDVMTHGEIVEVAALPAGTVITNTDATGVLGTAAVAAGIKRVGHTVEAARLVVRVQA